MKSLHPLFFLLKPLNCLVISTDAGAHTFSRIEKSTKMHGCGALEFVSFFADLETGETNSFTPVPVPEWGRRIP